MSAELTKTMPDNPLSMPTTCAMSLQKISVLFQMDVFSICLPHPEEIVLASALAFLASRNRVLFQRHLHQDRGNNDALHRVETFPHRCMVSDVLQSLA